MTNQSTAQVRLLTGARALHPDFDRVRKVRKDKKVRIRLQLARKPGGDQWVTDTINTISAAKVNGQIIRVSQETWDANAGADPSAVAGVHAFAKRRPYKVVLVDASMCEAVIEGKSGDVTADFGSDLQIVSEKGNAKNRQIQRIGPAPTLPVELAGKVKGVHMSTVPVAHTRHQFLTKPAPAAAAAAAFQGFTVLDISTIYHGVGGNGPRFKVAVGELGGGFKQVDFDTYCKSIGVKSTKVGVFTVDGGSNKPMGLSGAGGEVYLDLDGLAGLLNILFGFGPNTSASIAHQTIAARRAGAHAMSWSWGMYGAGWSVADRSLVGNAIAYFICTGGFVAFAQGDTGAVDGNPSGEPSTDFGGEHPLSWSSGGTLRVGGTDPSGHDEYWNDDPSESAGGYGESGNYPAPGYQKALGKTGRWCPDGSITGSPRSGIRVYGGGQTAVIGGTSDVPLFVREAALVSEEIGQPIGFIQPWLYAHNEADKLMTPVLDESGKVDPRCGLGTPNFANWVTSLKRLIAAAKSLPVPEGFELSTF